MITDNTLCLDNANKIMSDRYEPLYFDSSAFYDWERHWEEEE